MTIRRTWMIALVILGFGLLIVGAALPVGLGFREAGEDDWPDLVTKIKAADVVLFCTPIWWGGRSSLMQRVIERFDALDEEYSATGRSAIKGKVAGIVMPDFFGTETTVLPTLDHREQQAGRPPSFVDVLRR